MLKSNWLVILVTLFFVSGCVSQAPKMTVSNQPEAIIPARGFCMAGQTDCETRYPAYGYILFTSKPTKFSQDRYLAICEAFNAGLSLPNEIPAQSSQLAVTFWLLKSKPKNVKDCNELIELYDYGRAEKLISEMRLPHLAGPILVARSNLGETQDENTLLIDMGRFTLTELTDAINIWKDEISQDKRIWGKKIDVALVALKFRSFIQKYGAPIVQIVAPLQRSKVESSSVAEPT